MISQKERDDLGNALEEVCNNALDSFLPFESVTFKKRKKADGSVDFLIFDNGKLIIAIELKNWGDRVEDVWIESEIIPRYAGTPSYVMKFLVGHIPFSEEQKKKYLHKNRILFYSLPSQIRLKTEEMTDEEKRVIDDLKQIVFDDIVREVSLAIIMQTGKYRRDFVSPIRVRLIGGFEVRFELPDGTFLPLKNLMNKFHAKRRHGLIMGDYIKIGPRPLDIVCWHGNPNIMTLDVPREYETYSDKVKFFTSMTEDDGRKRKLEAAEKHPEWSDLSDEEQIVKVEEAEFEILRRLGSEFGIDMNYYPEDTLALLRSRKDYGLDTKLIKFFKGIIWPIDQAEAIK